MGLDALRNQIYAMPMPSSGRIRIAVRMGQNAGNSLRQRRTWYADDTPIPQLNVPQEGNIGRGMFKEAKELLKKITPSQRIKWFDNFREQIKSASGGSWQAHKQNLLDGGALYIGDAAPFWFLISPSGKMYQGSDIHAVTDFVGGTTIEGQSITNPLFQYNLKTLGHVPIYDNLEISGSLIE